MFGEVAGRACLERLAPGSDNGIEDANTQTAKPYKIISDIRPSDRSELDLADVRSSLRSVMWRHVGIEREGDHLADVQDMFAFWARYTLDKIFDDRLGWEVQNLLNRRLVDHPGGALAKREPGHTVPTRSPRAVARLSCA